MSGGADEAASGVESADARSAGESRPSPEATQATTITRITAVAKLNRTVRFRDRLRDSKMVERTAGTQLFAQV